MEKRIFGELLNDIGNKHDILGSKPLTAFCAMKGLRAVGELFVVGRAVNGWDVQFSARDLSEPTVREKVLAEIFAESEKADTCPMSWVANQWGKEDIYPNPARSAFWRVIRKIMGELNIADVNACDWSSHLIYSNLYKVAPKCGGNPTGLLASIQETKCGELLNQEFRQWDPTCILMLVGLDWFSPFQRVLQITGNAVPNSRFVQFVGEFEAKKDAVATKVVVAKHPGRKPEDAFVREVATAMLV